jgi:hypothetical protein
MRRAIDLHEKFVQLPLPIRKGSQVFDPPFPDLGGRYRPKPVAPKPDGFMADVNAAFLQKILDIPK